MDYREKLDFSKGSLVRQEISREFCLPKWKKFRDWFFQILEKQDREFFKEEFIKELSEKNEVIPFVPWFIEKYTESIISVIERQFNINGNIVSKVFPPPNGFKIEKQGEERYYQAFQKLLEGDTLQVTIIHINELIKQQNYSNLYLIIIGEQLQDLSKKMDNILSHFKEKQSSTSNKETIATPSIQLPPRVTDFKTKSEESVIHTLNESINILKNLKLNTITEFEENMSEENYKEKINDEILKLSKFADKPTQRMYYYPRPTPQDVLIEEQEYIVNNSYSGKMIYEWNIDGQTESQIYKTVHRMLMYATICQNNKNSTKTITHMIISGFTGQLKGWWDNYLSQEDKEKIINSVKEENGNTENNSVYTLIVNIIEHFTGRWSDNSENIRTLLQNLKCRTLTSFRWYKDTFLSRVMELPESNSSHWKSKFIDGLPHLFSERVRNNLRKGGININYDEYTYGKLIGTCIQEGLNLCNEIRLNQQIKKHSLNEKKQLGQFCDQFGIEKLITPKTNKIKKSNPHQHIKRKRKREDRKNKRNYEKYGENKFRPKPQLICKKCGKIGHKAKTCWVRKKLNKLEDEDLKNQISKILLDSESEIESGQSSDEDLNILEKETFSSSEEEYMCKNNNCDNECCSSEIKEDEIYQIISQFQNIEINVLTSEILDLLKLIKDPQTKERIISSYINQEEGESSNTQKDLKPFSLAELKVQLNQRNKNPFDIKELKYEIDNLKQEVRSLQQDNRNLETRIIGLEKISIINPEQSREEHDFFANNIMEIITSQKWYGKIKLLIGDDFFLEVTALFDSGADLNCIQEGLIPVKYYHKTNHGLSHAGKGKLEVNYKIPKAYICKDNTCINTSFVLVKNLSNQVILGTPFFDKIFPLIKVDRTGITGIYQGKEITFQFITNPITRSLNNIKQDLLKAKINQIEFLQKEISSLSIKENLGKPKLQEKIKLLEHQFSLQICNDHPNAFWDRKKHIVTLPYEEGFKESQIPTKARPCQMNSEYMELCKKEIKSLLNKNLIRSSKSSWSCTAFYVNKHSEQERGMPRLVINYKPLNKVLKWIRYPIPNKKDLLDKLYKANIFSKFDLKSGYWQIQIDEKDRYKTAFTVPIGHYEWNVMPFGLKNAPSEFQNIMNDIFIPYSEFIIVYIDDILVFSKDIETHFKHLEIFKSIIIKNGLVISRPKMMLFQTKIRFLGHNIDQGNIIPINRSIEFASKFPDEITDKTQLQRFLGSLNYILPYYKNLTQDTSILYDRLKKNPKPWSNDHTKAVQQIKQKVQNLPCLMIANPNWEKIVETDASEIGYGGILKQISPETKQEYLVRFHSGKWNNSQKNYATVAKEILAIVKCVLKFQDDLYNQKFIIKTDCQAAKYMFNKDFKHDVSKQMFARWQANLAPFDFEIVYKKGTDNSLPDYLTREYLIES